jgi:uncharacterized protein YecE (DUF72 family)
VIRTGTSGFSYRDWKPRFYPKDLPAAKMLAHYASRLATVEINNTFYRRPDPANLRAWAASVPSSFRFVFKASRYFSAGPGLRNAQKPLAEFFDLLAAVGDELGPLLVQFPAHVKKDLSLLRDFMGAIPGSPKRRVALDLRDPSWRADDVRAAMRDAGVAWCVTEADDEPLDLVVTAPWAYVRLRKSRYTARDLASFAERLKKADIDDGFVIFRHDDTGASALHAVALQEKLSEPSRRSSS